MLAHAAFKIVGVMRGVGQRPIWRRRLGVFGGRRRGAATGIACEDRAAAAATISDALPSSPADLAEARRLSSAATSLSPPSLEAVLASANLERRAGNFSAAAAALSSGAQRLSGDALAVLARHVAAAEWRAGRPEAGRAVLRAAVDRQPHSEMTWEAALAFEIEMDQARQAGRAARQMEIDADEEAGAAAENGGTAHGVAALVEALFERMLARETPLPPAAKRRAWLRYQQVCAWWAWRGGGAGGGGKPAASSSSAGCHPSHRLRGICPHANWAQGPFIVRRHKV